ncbi:iron-containing alcohol dehydrogenase [Bartonella sp. LJL80]
MGLINYVTRIQFGYGSLATLKDEVELASIKRPLLITDKGVRQLGVEEKLETCLQAKFAAVYDDTPGNPTEAAVRNAQRCFKEMEADGIIAIGGGSAIDLAKAVAIAAAHSGPLRDFAAIEGGANNITSRTYPVIAIPTTAGTGSEVGRGAIIILDDGRKVGLLSPYIIPKAAICDPELTLSLPAGLTAATGMDAISHCIETYLAPAFNPPADGIALEGLRRGWSHIKTATEHPYDRDARLNMMIASTMGAMAFQKGLGCVHSLSHSLGGVNPKLHHGTLNAIFLPAVLTFNRQASSAIAEHKFDRLARAMELPSAAHVEAAIIDVTQALGLPTKLSQLEVESNLFPAIINGALKDHSHQTNPREASARDYEEMLNSSI